MQSEMFTSIIASLLCRALQFINSERISILQLTDIHYDMFYKHNSSTSSFCHRNSAEDDEFSNPLWGRECDSSESLVYQSLEQISNRNHNISVILLTGDNSR